ncbi:hypothetical protein KCP75_15560 [Salmonella enterica subsp. enterica]|nr:hypothetical protein KCP75_15560 [Salmonella enterica subsp. enterica]
MENESRSDVRRVWMTVVDASGRSYHIGRCAQDANVQDEQAASQEKLSR